MSALRIGSIAAICALVLLATDSLVVRTEMNRVHDRLESLGGQLAEMKQSRNVAEAANVTRRLPRRCGAASGIWKKKGCENE